MDNPFSKPQCTWHAWQRMKDATSLELTFSKDTGRNGGQWFSLVNNVDKFAKQDPKKSLEKTVACYSDDNGGYGHVSFIESVDEVAKTVTISESYDGLTSPKTVTRTFASFFAGSSNQSWTFQGYLRKKA